MDTPERPLAERYADVAISAWQKPPYMHVVGGQGSYVYDVAGKEYLDWLKAVHMYSLGYGHPALKAATANQREEMPYGVPEGAGDNLEGLPPFFLHEDIVMGLEEVRRRVAHIAPFKVLPASSGSMANDMAVRLAHAALSGEKARNMAIYVPDIGYNGANVRGNNMSQAALQGASTIPLGIPVRRFSIDEVDKAIGPIQDVCEIPFVLIEDGMSGVGAKLIQDEVMRAVAETVHRRDGLLALDNVQAGWGNTATAGKFPGWIGNDNWRTDPVHDPDIVVGGKGIGGGASVAYMAARSDAVPHLNKPLTEYADGFWYDTNAMNNADWRRLTAVSRVIEEEGLIDRVANETGPYLDKRLQELAGQFSEFYSHTEGRGIMRVLAPRDPTKALDMVAAARKEGLLLVSGTGRLRVFPHVNTTKAQIDEGIEKLRAATEAVLKAA